MAHAEAAPMIAKRIAHIGKPAATVVEINVKPGKVIDHHQIQIMVTIQVHQRGAVRAAVALVRQPGRLGGIGEAAAAIV